MEEVARLRETADRYAGKGVTEQDTKNAIIEPILALFGWPKTDLGLVRAEYRHTSRDNPVDYALMQNDKPVLLVEAKALDKSLDDHKFIRQNLSYAHAANVEWALLSNGRRWDLYAVFDREEPERRRVFSVLLDDPGFIVQMRWIRPEHLVGKGLDRHWRMVRARRKVLATLSEMVERRDDELVDLIFRRSGVDCHDVRGALEELRLRFDHPAQGVDEVAGRHPDVIASSARQVAPTPSNALAVPTELAPTLFSRAAPPPGTKPRRVTIRGQSRDVVSWRALLVAAIELVHAARPDQFVGVFDSAELAGASRRYFDRQPDAMHSPLQVPGGFVEGNQSGPAVVRLVLKLVDFVGLSREEFGYEIR